MNDHHMLAGAAKVVITPDASYFPLEHFGKSVFSGKILNDIYARILILNNGYENFVLLTLDLPGVPNAKMLEQFVAETLMIPIDSVVVTATHNHSGPYFDNVDFEHMFGSAFIEKKKKWMREFVSSIKTCCLEAKSNMQRAKIGFGKGECYLNVNRVEHINGKPVIYGYNLKGSVDRELSVMKVVSETDQLIGLVYNYAMHACTMIHNNPEGIGTEISADVPGVCCRMFETETSDDAVVQFVSGAAGDLNPIMMARVNKILKDGSVQVVDTGKAGHAIMENLGKILYNDVKAVSDQIVVEDHVTIWNEKTYVMCSKEATNKPYNNEPLEFVFGLHSIDGIMIATSNGEVVNSIGKRIKASLPSKQHMYMTHAGDWTGYVYEQAEGGNGEFEKVAINTFETMASRHF